MLKLSEKGLNEKQSVLSIFAKVRLIQKDSVGSEK